MALHVERHGSGRDLVLLHGWGLHGGVWSALAASLAATFRVHLVDLPGHGGSRDVPLDGIDGIVAAVADVTPAGAQVCGWSLGGLVALRLASRHPEQVAALTLVSTTPSFVQRDDWPHAMARATLEDFAHGLRTDPARTIRKFVNLNALGGPQARERMRELAELYGARGTPSANALAAGLALLLDTDLRGEVGRIGVPARVIHGARDALVPVEAGRWLAAALPGAQLVEIDAAAHLPFVSHAGLVARALEQPHG
jgi:pimeloyl-[acyl-carrier protein] methyl ester esterase